MNTRSSLVEELKSKDYRDAFVASQLRIGLPMQCRALRESRELTQPELAELAGMSQPRISEIERPGERKLNLETLLRLASAFDVALQVRFVPFSQLVDDDDHLDLNDFYVEPFLKDLEHAEKLEEKMKSVKVMQRPSQLSDALLAGDQLHEVAVAKEEKPSASSRPGIAEIFQTELAGEGNESISSIAC